LGEFIVALGLAIAMEGLLLAAAPRFMRRSMLEAAARPDNWLRHVGIGAAGFGILVIAAAQYWL
jgi:hypothetical protein